MGSDTREEGGVSTPQLQSVSNQMSEKEYFQRLHSTGLEFLSVAGSGIRIIRPSVNDDALNGVETQLGQAYHAFRLANNTHKESLGKPASSAQYNMACCFSL